MLHSATGKTAGHRGPVSGAARAPMSVLSSELRLIYPEVSARGLVRYLDEMHWAMVQQDTSVIFDVLNNMRRAGLRDADIADFYVPVVARRLGEGWVEDTLEFNQVSVGVSNLQTMLRGLDASWNTPERGPFGTMGTVCIIVPKGVQHTLGASILTGQMRRAGYDVKLGADLGLDAIAKFVSNPATVGVMISASAHEPLDFLRQVVGKTREGNRWVPILIGGNVLDQNCDVCAATGADHATSDWQTALRYCADRVAT